jgi:hypothetical protein
MPWFVSHYRLEEDGTTYRHRLLRVYEVQARHPRAAMLEAKFMGCAPMPNDEYLVASHTDPRSRE